MARLLTLLLLAALSLNAQTLEVRLNDAIVTPGGIIQLWVSLSEPRPLSGGVLELPLEPQIVESVDSLALLSPDGEAGGAAVLRSGGVTIRFTSPSATLGTIAGSPFLVVNLRAATLLGSGARLTVNLDPTSILYDDFGRAYTITRRAGSISVGGTLNIGSVVPGGGPVVTGSAVRINGSGFTPQTLASIDGVRTSGTRYVNANQLEVSLGEDTNLHGRRVEARNPGGESVSFYSSFRSQLATISNSTLLNATLTAFPAVTVRTASLTVTVPQPGTASRFDAVSLQNPNAAEADIEILLFSPGGDFLQRATLPLPGGARTTRRLAELLPNTPIPSNGMVRLNSTLPIQILGLTADVAASTVLPVALTGGITPQLRFTPVPSSLRFTYVPGQPVPIRATVQLGSQPAGLGFTILSSDPEWLSVSPVAGTVPATLTVSLQPGDRPAGEYRGTLTFRASNGAVSTPMPVTMIITSSGALEPHLSAAVHGAAQQEGAISPGLIATAYGELPGVPDTGLRLTGAGDVDTSLAGVRLLVNGIPSPLTFVSDRQVNAVIPYEVENVSEAAIAIELNGRRSNARTYPVVPANPGIFTIDASGQNQAAALNQDGTTNTEANPAGRGEDIVIYATGEGQTSPPARTASVTTGTFLAREEVAVLAGGRPCAVRFAGAAPSFVAGVLQVNCTLAPDTPVGSSVPLVLLVGGRPSRAGVTVAVR